MKSIIFIGLVTIAAIAVLGLITPAEDTPGPRTSYANDEIETRATPQPPYTPLATSPPDGSTGITQSPVTLSWEAAERYRGRVDHTTITNFHLQVATSGSPNSNGGNADVFDGDVGPDNSKTINVDMGVHYYWAVRADDADGSTWSNVFDFTTNALPVATIDRVDPATPREGQEITFRGTAEDPDGGAIEAYEWKSSIDGVFGDSASTSTELSEGDHIITFRAQDEIGLWSTEAQYSLRVEVNSEPTRPTSILPREAHDQTPTLRWSASSDPEFDKVTYHISIGTSYGGSDIVDDETTTSTSYQISRKLAYAEESAAKTYYVSIYAVDECGARSDTLHDTFDLVNNAPPAPGITITPQQPLSSQYLVCTINYPSQDEDDDNVEYSYEWYVSREGGFGFQHQSNYDDETTIPARETQVGDRWRCKVTPIDEMGAIGKVAEYEVEIMNARPEILIESPENADEDRDGYISDEEREEYTPFLTGQSIRFDASKTVDPDGHELEFEWDFGDDSDGSTNEKPRHRYDEAGEYEVTVTVSDGFEEAERTIWVIVEYPPTELQLRLNFPPEMEQGERYALTVNVENIGDGPAHNVVVWYIDVTAKQLIGNDSIKEIPKGESEQSAVYWRAKDGHEIHVYWTDEDHPAPAYIERFFKNDTPLPPTPMTQEVVTEKSGEGEGFDFGGNAGWLIAVILIGAIIAILFVFLFMRQRWERELAQRQAEEEREERAHREPEAPTGHLRGPMGMPGMQQMGGMGLPGAGRGGPGMMQPAMGLPYPQGPGMYGQQQQAPALGLGPGPGLGGQYGQPMMALPPGQMQPQMGGQMGPQQGPGAQGYGMDTGYGGQAQPGMGMGMGGPGQPPAPGPGPSPGPGPGPAQSQYGGQLALPQGQDTGPGQYGGYQDAPMQAQPDMGGYDYGPQEQPQGPPAGPESEDQGAQMGPDMGAPIDEGPTCPHCGTGVEEGWLMCPECKGRLK